MRTWLWKHEWARGIFYMVIEVDPPTKTPGGRYLAFNEDGSVIDDVRFTARPHHWEEVE